MRTLPILFCVILAGCGAKHKATAEDKISPERYYTAWREVYKERHIAEVAPKTPESIYDLLMLYRMSQNMDFSQAKAVKTHNAEKSEALYASVIETWKSKLPTHQEVIAASKSQIKTAHPGGKWTCIVRKDVSDSSEQYYAFEGFDDEGIKRIIVIQLITDSRNAPIISIVQNTMTLKAFKSRLDAVAQAKKAEIITEE
jgi:hypothetical protein